jgi:hypothetical protein
VRCHIRVKKRDEFVRNDFRLYATFGLIVLLCCSQAAAQGAAPESAPPLFPGGGLISYNSTITTRAAAVSGIIPVTARPTFSHQGTFNFTWGFHPDLDLTLLVPVVTHRFEDRSGNPATGGTGLGDAVLLLKYRFRRNDSARGTTQASVTIGPKLPTGQTDFAAPNAARLPAGLQAGSGSTDLFVAANWTYTGLFNFRRLVADEDFHSLVRSRGTQATRLGSEVESRFWLSYRPYEAKDGSREWFMGPALTWQHFQNDNIAGITQPDSGGDLLLPGITSYLGVRPGVHLWLAIDWDAAHSSGAAFMPVRRHISFGITQQFRIHR